MILGQILRDTEQAFRAAGIPDPKLDAELILAEALHEPRLNLLLRKDRPLTSAEEETARGLIRRRLSREPLQYVLGEAWFFSLPLRVGKGVLIPRADTESVCLQALSVLDRDRPSAVLDLCTGSGALALVLCKERPLCSVTATDLSWEALSYARLNARQNGLEVTFFQGDLWDALPPGLVFDLVVSNPPYIPDAEIKHLQAEVLFEPASALKGGPDGLVFYRRILLGLPGRLRTGGSLCLECGDGQTAALAGLMEGRFDRVLPFRDLNGHPRGVLGKGYHD